MTLIQWRIHSNNRRCFSGALKQQPALFQRGAVTFSERLHEPVLTNIKKSDDRRVQRTRQKHDRRSYISVGIGSDSQSILEREPTRSKYRGLLLTFFSPRCLHHVAMGRPLSSRATHFVVVPCLPSSCTLSCPPWYCPTILSWASPSSLSLHLHD